MGERSGTILVGDVLEGLGGLQDQSVQCVVTSPPYWGLRDYGVEGQLGLEPTPEEYIARIVEAFREVRRVLRDDGILWLNLGDSYAGSRAAHEGFGTSTLKGSRDNQRQANLAARTRSGKDCDPKRGRAAVGQPYRAVTHSRRRDDIEIPRSDVKIPGRKAKDLVGIPWLVAFALLADGWYLRLDIIWSKPNPMPESVRDRCTKAHEYLFLLSKRPRYYYDQEAILEEASLGTYLRLNQDLDRQEGSARAHAGAKVNGKMKAVRRHLPGNKTHKGTTAYESGDERMRTKAGLVDYSRRVADLAEQAASGACGRTEKRNRRSVWEVATQPFSDAHFAVFPTALVQPCILAGSKPGDVILDPFCGAGTTGLVALRHERGFVGVELNPEYARMAARRITSDAPVLNRVQVVELAVQSNHRKEELA